MIRLRLASLVGATLLLACWGRQVIVKSPMPNRNVTTEYPHGGPTCGPDTISAKEQLPDSVFRWVTFAIPEYQDDQKFIAGQHGPYGPLACVVARPGIDKINQTAFMTGNGVLVAVVWVKPGQTLTAPYTRLRLSAGFNCVYLHLIGLSGGPGTPDPNVASPAEILPQEWHAYIVPSNATGCAPVSTANHLTVVPIGVPGWSGDSVPAVARFVADHDWMAGIGIRCLTGWCTIGYPSGLMRRQPHDVGSGPESTHRLVLGWFDDQELGNRPSVGAPLAPDVRASIIPEHGLDGYKLYPDFQDRWQVVATVHYHGAPTGKYGDAMYWGFTDAANKENVISLRHSGTDINTGWQVMIDGVIKDPAHMRVIRIDHSAAGFHVVGTARWRWNDVDEAVWIRCDEGCCLIEPV
jgi:hypothetical protein